MASDHAPIVMDAGGLISIERRASVMRLAVDRAAAAGARVVIPAPVLAQVWRGGARQALLGRFLRLPFVEVDLLSTHLWRAAGELCGDSGTSDVVDAAVVVCARERGAHAVVTSDPDDLRRLDLGLAYWTV
ncbi:MAG: PIN domain-containing protein [Pseudonocardia sp.]